MPDPAGAAGVMADAASPPSDGAVVYDFFIVGPQLSVPRVQVTLPDGEAGFDYAAVRGSLEAQLNMKVGAIDEMWWHDRRTDVWEDLAVVPPPQKAKLWVKYSDGPPMLGKEHVPNGTAEFQHCDALLQTYMKPFLDANIGARVTLTKVAALSNPQSEHLYQVRRRELFDPENVTLLTVGGSKSFLKNIASYGFELPAGAGQFGENAMVFGSDVRGVATEEQYPTHLATNKLLVCEAALGIPKVLSRPSPSATLDNLRDEGYDSAVLPNVASVAGGGGQGGGLPMSYVVTYHPQQVIPRFLLTYSLEYIDPELLCPVSGDMYKLVSRDGEVLECIRCVTQGQSGRAEGEFEPIEDAAAREKSKFVAQQDAVSAQLTAIRNRFAEIEYLNRDAVVAYDDLVDRVSDRIKEITDLARTVGLRLVEQARDKHLAVRERLDAEALRLQALEARSHEIHQHLSQAFHTQSDVYFQKSLASFKAQQERLQLSEDEVRIGEDPGLQDALAFLKQCEFTTEPVVRQLEELERKGLAWQAPERAAAPAPPQRSGSGSARRSRSRERFGDASGTRRNSSGLQATVSIDASRMSTDPQASLRTKPSVASNAPLSERAPSLVTAGDAAPAPNAAGGVVGMEESEAGSARRLDPVPHHPSTGAGGGRVPPLPQRSGTNLSADAVLEGTCGSAATTPTHWGAQFQAAFTVTAVDGDVHGVQPDALLSTAEAGSAASRKVLLGFGRNDNGQVGVGHTNNIDRPMEVGVPNTASVLKCAVGRAHTIVCTDDQRVYAFGDNSKGQLGLGHHTNMPNPTPLYSIRGLMGDVQDVACGDYHSMLLTVTGKVFAWGANEYGQLGMGHEDQQHTPWRVAVQQHVAAIGCGARHSACLTKDGEIYAWGDNSVQQLGAGGGSVRRTSTPTKVALPVTGGMKVSQMVVGGFHTAVLMNTHTHIFVWGDNSDGRLGLGHTQPVVSPRLIASLNNPSNPYVMIAAGYSTTSAVTRSGHSFTWGAPPAHSAIPVQNSQFSAFNAVKVATGTSHEMMLTAENNIFTVGANLYGELGLGHKNSADVPACVALPQHIAKRRHRVVDIITRSGHCFLLVAVGQAVADARPNLTRGLRG